MAAVLPTRAKRTNKGLFCRTKAFIRNNNAADRLTACWFAIEKQVNERKVRVPEYSFQVFCVGDIKHIKTTENKLDLKSILRTRWALFCISPQSPPRKLSILIAISEPSTFHSSL